MMDTGERKNKYQSHTGFIKLISDDNSDYYFRLGIYENSWDSEQFAGPATHFLGQSYQLNQDWTDGNGLFHMANAVLSKSLPSDIQLEINGFSWKLEHEFTSDLTLSPAGGPFGNYFTQGQTDKRSGVNIIIKQPSNKLNTQWVVSYGFNQMGIYSTFNKVISVDGALVAKSDAAYEGLDRNISSLFIQAKTAVLDKRIDLLYGGRFDDYSDFGTKKTPRIGAIYHPDELSAIKLLYGSAFRAATGTELAGTGTTEGNPDINPEEIDTYELIFMKHNNKWKYEFVIFQSKWTEGIEINNDTYQNSGKSESHGTELTFNYIGGTLRVDLSGSYVSSENETQSYDYVAFPEYIFNLGFGYTWHSQNIKFYLSNRFHLNAKEGPVKDTIPDPDDIDDYFRTDLHVSKKISGELEIWLNIRNLFDCDNYLPSVWNSEGGIPDENFSLSIGGQYFFGQDY